MKKTLLKLTLSVFALSAVVFSLSSCLGDSDSSYELSNDFVYINTSDIYTYAVNTSGNMMVTGDAIRAMTKGDCAIISYKINTGNANAAGIFEAENLQVIEKFFNRDQATIERLSVPSVIENPVYPKTLSVSKATSGNYMGDRWLFSISYDDENDSKFVPQFYYDESNQIEIVNGEEVDITEKKNQVILDVRFTKKNINTSDQKTAKTESFVANLHDLKRMFTNLDYSASDAVEYEAGKKAVPVYVKFRYYKPGEENPTYLGSSWTSSGYYIYFFQGEDF